MLRNIGNTYIYQTASEWKPEYVKPPKYCDNRWAVLRPHSFLFYGV
jgi:hypothetical protein